MGIFDRKKKNFFKYVTEIDATTMQTIENTYRETMREFNISDSDDGSFFATEIMNRVDEILKTGKYPDEYTDLTDVAVGLGILFGHAVCIGYRWKWKYVSNDAKSPALAIVSPKENYCNFPMTYINTILAGENIGLYGENDNTVLLLYNMLKDIDKKPRDKKYYPVS